MRIMGYHGTSLAVAHAIESGQPFRRIYRDYHWLGTGAYFFVAFNCEKESARDRAKRWAEDRFASPAVLEAEIDERDQLDLWEDASARAGVARIYREHLRRGTIMPSQVLGSGAHYLDRYVIDQTCDELAAGGDPVATVKALFEEYPLLYATCGFIRDPHLQVAVRDVTVVRNPTIVWKR
jgi:hypothetical protein